MTEIETVTVAFEDLKANLDHYLAMRGTKRIAVIRDGEQVAVLGLRLPDDERGLMTPQWIRFFRDLFPPEPVDMNNTLSRLLEEDRGYRPST